MENFEIGLTGEFQVEVTPPLTASAMGSGSVSVYATPALVAALEAAAVAAVADRLKEGDTSVGIYLDVQHLAASPVGAKITAKAEVIALEERHIIFTLEAHDEHELIAKGTHRRAVVNTARFLEKVTRKSKPN